MREQAAGGVPKVGCVRLDAVGLRFRPRPFPRSALGVDDVLLN